MKISDIILTESYQDRVDQVVKAVISSDPKSKEDIMQRIGYAGERYAPVEYSLKKNPKSKAWPDFVKDVTAGLKGKIKLKRASSSTRPSKEKNDELLRKISNDIMAAAGESFPDGDPIDILIPRLRKYGIDHYDVGMWLDKAARKHLGVKSFHRYLANLWDEFKADNPEYSKEMGMGDRNPWR